MESYGSNQIVVLMVILCNMFAVTEESVTLTTFSDFADKGSLRCNSKVVLMCKVQPYSIMAWEIDSQVAAECTYNSCSSYIIDEVNYGYCFDTSNGIFNITLDPVTFADNGKIFKCDDGYTYAYITAQVKVIPVNSDTTISSIKGSSSTEIKATSGCVHPSTSVQFEWYYFKKGNAPVLYKESQPLQSADEYGCTSGSCGGKGVVRVTSTLIIQEDSNGDEYYFQVMLKHPDKTDIIIRTDKLFKLKGTGDVESSSAAPVRDTSGAGEAKLNIGVISVSLFVTYYLHAQL